MTFRNSWYGGIDLVSRLCGGLGYGTSYVLPSDVLMISYLAANLNYTILAQHTLTLLSMLHLIECVP
jgi:hypothetical protein